MYKDHNLSLILPKARETGVVVIGEVHGVKENVDFLKQLINSLGVKNVGMVAFELPHSLQDKLNNLPENKDLLLKNKEMKLAIEDGRFSKYHLDFIEWLIRKGIKIVAIDTPTKNWNKRDKKMFELFKENLPKDKIALAIVGNLHARGEPFKLDNQKYIPFASHFDNYTKIDLDYFSGQFYNKGVKDFPNKREARNGIEIKNGKIKYTIEEATPTKKEP